MYVLRCYLLRANMLVTRKEGKKERERARVVERNKMCRHPRRASVRILDQLDR